ncbi:hypothetical protein CVD25_07735 [Bacillus canaveralius]|uniref:Damage-inducible protein DinB n=1 Tax=Bacillus canaveralius TaxID=1403243 RepID=A0A2N5GS95_9BACI|nr:hypothetical protein CU635_01890 [Bacillus canaveralius]PLR86618.1 hypothetical protein CVD23_06185 [Bacillus sp. V33-4]PLR98647.1 hypothetical protein CVD25_07735 [Bacillus canaveralius]
MKLDSFKYNWQVREEWFEWCKDVSNDELLKNRVGGIGSIIKTLFHVVDAEQIWIHP